MNKLGFAFSIGLMVAMLPSSAQLQHTDNDLRLALIACSEMEPQDKAYQCYVNLAQVAKKTLHQEQTELAHNKTMPKPPAAPNAAAASAAAPAPSQTPPGVSKERTVSQAMPDKFRAPDLLTRTVERATQDANKNWIFYFTNGEVWKQADTRRRRMPDLPVEATLKEGSFGSYRMKLATKSWSMKVKRAK